MSPDRPTTSSATRRNAEGDNALDDDRDNAGAHMGDQARDRRVEIESIFEEALDVPPDRRAAWLAARCGPDEALRADVEALLGARR